MKIQFASLCLLLSCHLVHAESISAPNCVDGKWQMPDSRWSLTQATPCGSNHDIQPYIVQASFTNPHGSGLRYTMTVKFFNTKGMLAATTVSHYFTPWGGLWTGSKRSDSALCPGTGNTAIDNCPIVIPH